MNLTQVPTRLAMVGVTAALLLAAAACGGSDSASDSSSTTTGTGPATKGLLDSFLGVATDAGFEVTPTETECMTAFLSTRPELAAKTEPADRQDSRDANEMLVSCLGAERTGMFLVGDAPEDSKTCVGGFFATFDDATLIDEMTATIDTPPGTLYDTAQAKCPVPTSAPPAAPAPVEPIVPGDSAPPIVPASPAAP
jgi:hypothetical protein